MAKRYKKGGGRFKKKTAIKKHDPESKIKLDPFEGRIVNKAPNKNDISLASNVFKQSILTEVIQSHKKRKHKKNKSENVIPSNTPAHSIQNQSSQSTSHAASTTMSKEEVIRNSLPKWKQIPQLDTAARAAKIKLKDERRKEAKKGLQREGETRKQYIARVEEEKERKLAEARRKVSGKQRKLKTQKHNLKRLEKLKKKGRGHSDDILFTDPTSKPVFGEVVERPPIFEESLKLKMNHLLKKSRPSSQMMDLENYVSDVQASYNILKQKRQVKEQQ